MRVRRISTAASSTSGCKRGNPVAPGVARAHKTWARGALGMVRKGTMLRFYDSHTVTIFRDPNVRSIHAHRGQIL
ncbi:conserved hypothetical protein [Paraburkholderia sabiae]|nr:conserved hypothetical protein [Paraburkholderia sabiae]